VQLLKIVVVTVEGEFFVANLII